MKLADPVYIPKGTAAATSSVEPVDVNITALWVDFGSRFVGTPGPSYCVNSFIGDKQRQ